MRRIGCCTTAPDGSERAGEFERISWDTALDIIADRFSAIVSEYGGEALLPLNYLGSMGIVQRRALMRLFHALGASQRPAASAARRVTCSRRKVIPAASIGTDRRAG
jgi:anaerobic selenocysteine-containing dehydrogenase